MKKSDKVMEEILDVLVKEYEGDPTEMLKILDSLRMGIKMEMARVEENHTLSLTDC